MTVALKLQYASELPEGLLEHALLIPTPRASLSVRESPGIAFLTSSQVMAEAAGMWATLWEPLF